MTACQRPKPSPMGTPTKTPELTVRRDDAFELGHAIELLLERRVLSAEQAATLRHDAAARRIAVARELRERWGSDGGFVSPLEVFASFRFPSRNPRHEFIDEEELCRAFAEASNVPFTRIDPLKLDARTLAAIVSKPFAQKHLMVPIGLESQRLSVAMVNPFDRTAIHNIEHATGYAVEPMLGLRGEILKTINEIFAFERSLQKAEKMRTTALDMGNLEQLVDIRGDEELDSSDQHVVRAVDLLLQYAFEQRASDIHIEPKRERAVVRLRIDGCLHDTHSVPKQVYPSFVSRIKIMSRLDIAEKRRPQDGRIKSAFKDSEIEIRVSTVPVAFGEKVVLRIFDPTILLQDVTTSLGFTPEQMTSYQHVLEKPHGIILVTGPTGSGKTTTLYSSLQHLSSPEVNVVTIEDPIEMVHEPFNQIAVQDSVGISFANALRSVLRQDPDIIMVGEIRDTETAQYAIQAALTGHLVFSTLHTNTAIGAITRLIDLGIERFLVASTVIGLVAQRLMRMVCPACGEPDHVPAETLQLLGIAGDVNQSLVRRGTGCEKCRRTGYFGRTAAFEVIELTDAMRVMIRDNASETDIAKLARKDGAEPLLSNASRKLLAGKTTPEEILRVVPATW